MEAVGVVGVAFASAREPRNFRHRERSPWSFVLHQMRLTKPQPLNQDMNGVLNLVCLPFSFLFHLLTVASQMALLHVLSPVPARVPNE